MGCFGLYTGGEYLLYGPDFSRRVVHLRSRTPEDLVRDLRQAGLRLLYASPWLPEQKEILRECLERGLLVRKGYRFYAADP